MTDILDNVNIGENTSVEVSKHGNIHEDGMLIKGFVTVVHRKAKTGEEVVLCEDKPNLLVDAGRDSFHTALYVATSASQVGFNFLAVSDNATAPNVADTTVAGEITTGGLARILATTRTHTGGTNTSTVGHTFTASATHSNVQKSGLFDAVTVGVLSHENTFTSANLEINDTLTVTWTLTLG